jgi:hypothetical protein
MNIPESDIATIHDLLWDCHWFFEHANELYSLPYIIVSPKERETVLRPYRDVKDHIANTAPLLIKVLSMDLPAGFVLLRTIDGQCLAWNSHVILGMHGPVSEFQARLWCWQNEHVNDEIKITIIEEEEVVKESFDGFDGLLSGVSQIEEDEETLEGFRASLGGVGNVSMSRME